MPRTRKGHRSTDPPSREKHLRWLGLRKRGFTFDEIADQEGVSRQAVHQAVRLLIRRTMEDAAEDVIALENARLDELQREVWDQATLAGDEEQLPAVDRVLRIMERRAKMLGLDGKDTGTGDESREVPIDELRELLDGLGYRLVRKDGEEG